jgi:cardiolipin synthase A/B
LRLLVQPGESARALIQGIDTAKKSVEIVIFRFDRRDIERALKSAVSRGVFTHALIAHTNSGGEEHLRRLETRLLEAGGTVARTADDLLRYHYKMIIIDRRVLYLLAFNFTYLDIERSRTFGVITRNRKFVQEAIKLFEADTRRQPYAPGLPDFLVSPTNARKQLCSFISNAKKQLLIYDLKISDRSMIRLLENRARSGVDVRIIGRLTRRNASLPVRKLRGMRLHVRTMIKDGRHAFIGSQSLRQVELDNRREVGIIFRDPKVVSRLIHIFEDDWNSAEVQKAEIVQAAKRTPLAKAAKKVAKAVAKDLPPVTPVLEQAVKEVVGDNARVELDAEEIEKSVKKAVKEAIKEAVKDAVEEVADQQEADKFPK